MSDFTIIKTEDLKLLIQGAVADTISKAFSDFAPTPVTDDTVFMNVNEAANFLHKKRSTIYRHVWKRELPSYKRGNKLLFIKTELQQWAEKGKRKTTEELEVIAKQRNQ